MSLELVSRCLELDVEPVPAAGKKKKKDQATGSKNAMNFILTDRQGVWKGLRKLQKKQRKEVAEKRKKQKIKSAIEKYQENIHDHTEASVEALQRLTELGKVDDLVAEKILYKQPCKLSRDVKEEVSQPVKSVFTEADFDKFEKEYRPK
ncbi:unnamed protein product [Candidula unifasciata]|uniref:40S ribosomal protein S19-binding protein 1 n=1 Tax=Candidula unifasciata TaxID=100452 RepID=A0A8S3ZPK3_9EUPU|nr:unnamed protein product [Candidula unifasciata]